MKGNHSLGRSTLRSLLTVMALSAISSGGLLPISSYANPSTLMAESQQSNTVTINITVVDEKGEPVIGANVKEKNTSNGGVTDLNGKLRLNVREGATIVVSYIGYVAQELPAKRSMRVVLKEDLELLDEVVVVGYGQQKKVNLTGAVASVDLDKTIDSRPVTDVARALQGAVPGLTITSRSGEIGSTPNISIRGAVGSPNGSGKPLILLDNVEISDLSLINPDDIESVSVLKDASSASIYGARGAFGVILITTKSKKKYDSLVVNYSNNFAWRTPTVKPTQLPGWQQADINLKGVENSVVTSNSYSVIGNLVIDAEGVKRMKAYWDMYGFGDQFGPELVEGRDFDWDGTGLRMYRTFDWYDMYVKDWMPQQTHNLSVAGGNGKTNYNVSLGYLNQEGLTKINSDKYKRYTGTLSLNSELNKYITIRALGMYTRPETVKPYNYGSTLYDHMYYLYRWQPVYPYGTLDGKEFRSALTELKVAPPRTITQDFIRVTGGATIRPLEGLTLDMDVVYNNNLWHQHFYGAPSLVAGYNLFTAYKTFEAFKNSYSHYLSKAYDFVQVNDSRTEGLTGNFVGTYSKILGDHNFKAMLGSNIEKSEYRYTKAEREGLLSIEKPELGMATGKQVVDSEHTWWAVAGFFGRLNYSYKDRYLLELNGRYDGSSRFPKGQRFAFFPSMSAGYRISEEPFFQSLKPYISDLKLRGSWGTIGNQDVGPDRFLSVMESEEDSWVIDGQKTQSTKMPTLVYPTLHWEKVSTLDFGFDARFFNNALGVTFDWYRRTTSDILAEADLPWTLGANPPYQNMGELVTPGWELAVDYHHEFDNGLYLNLTASISDYFTKVTKWTPNTTMPTYGSAGRGWWSTAYYKEGMILGDIWGLTFDRFLNEGDFNEDGSFKKGVLDQSQVFPKNYRYAPGDVLYKDLGGEGGKPDGKITKGSTVTEPGDLSVIGNALPRYHVGFNLDAAFRGFDFSMFLQGVLKRDLWAAGNQVLPGFTSGEPYYEGAEDYWTKDNPDAFYPRPMVYGQATIGNFQVNDRYLLNMAYLRCKSLTFGYTLPRELLAKAHVKKLRVYFTGENLFTFDKVKPAIDPEIDIRFVNWSADQRNFGRSYPYQKSLSFGLQLTL